MELNKHMLEITAYKSLGNTVNNEGNLEEQILQPNGKFMEQ